MAGTNAQTRYTYSIPLASASLPSSAAQFRALAAFASPETLTGGYAPTRQMYRNRRHADR